MGWISLTVKFTIMFPPSGTNYQINAIHQGNCYHKTLIVAYRNTSLYWNRRTVHIMGVSTYRNQETGQQTTQLAEASLRKWFTKIYTHNPYL
jgi:dipeptidase